MANNDEGADPVEPQSDGVEMPRWVKVSIIVLAVLGVLVVIMAVTGGGGGHGPERHGAGSTSGSELVAAIAQAPVPYGR